MTNSTSLLSGKVVAITRPINQSKDTIQLIEQFGGKVYLAPMIEIVPTNEKEKLIDLLEDIVDGKTDHLVFLSLNSVKFLFNLANDKHMTNNLMESIKNIKIHAIGKKTLQKLKQVGIRNAILASKQSTEGILKSFDTDLSGQRIAIPRSNLADKEIFQSLTKRGAQVKEVTAYISKLPTDRSKAYEFLNDLKEEKIDAVAFTSASSAKNLFTIAKERSLVNELKKSLDRVTVAAIGPKTSGTLEELGVKVHVVPEEYSIESLVESLVIELNRW